MFLAENVHNKVELRHLDCEVHHKS